MQGRLPAQFFLELGAVYCIPEVVTGTIRLDEGDKIVVNGTLDLSGATVEIIADNLSSSFVFASATSGITGVPAVAETGRWNKRCAIRGVGNEMRVARYGLVVVIK